jgi:hypothetical protein
LTAFDPKRVLVIFQASGRSKRSTLLRRSALLSIDPMHSSLRLPQRRFNAQGGCRRAFVHSSGTPAPDPSAYGSDNAEYRTERDTFSKIRSYRGSGESSPSGFRVWTKSGLVMDFGLDFTNQTVSASYSAASNSRAMTNFVNAQGQSLGVAAQKVSRWMLRRVWDRNGSFIEFRYCHSGLDSQAHFVCYQDTGAAGSTYTGSVVLDYVQYTNRSTNLDGRMAVKFTYEDRPDRVPAYHAGSRSVQVVRLRFIDTYVNWSGNPSTAQNVKRYSLNYEPLKDGAGASIRATNASRIASIQEFDAGGNSLPPIVFSLETDRVFGQAVAHESSGSQGSIDWPIEACGGSKGKICR